MIGICLHPSLAIEYAQAHVFLSRIGYPDEHFDAMLEKSINAQSHFGRERPPHRMLEQEWVKRVWSGSCDPARKYITDAIAYSTMTRPVDLLHGTREDLYAFTHALMYATCFNSAPWGINKESTEILDEAEAMLARCLDEQDYDLAGELLLAWPLTGSDWSALATFAFNVLLRVEDEASFLPSPATCLDILEYLEGDQRKKYFHATAYHTVYVMGLLCSASLKADRIPPQNITADETTSGISDKLLSFLELNGQAPHWLSCFSKLTGAEQDSLVDLLLNVATYRNVQQKQYGAVFEVVRIAYETGIGSQELVTQAAELLDRLSLMTGM